MSELYIGIDPGKKGAIAIITRELEVLSLFDMPLLENKEVDALTLHDKISEYNMKENVEAVCVLEKAQAMRNQGVCSTFTYGEGYGCVKAALQLAEVCYQEVHPLTWKTYLRMTRKGFTKKQKKDLSLQFSKEIFKGADIKKKDGRAEALLLAYYGVLKYI